MEENTLTEKELKDISLGYRWNPNMSFDDFVKSNKNITYANGYSIYEMIEKRYIEYKFESN